MDRTVRHGASSRPPRRASKASPLRVDRSRPGRMFADTRGDRDLPPLGQRRQHSRHNPARHTARERPVKIGRTPDTILRRPARVQMRFLRPSRILPDRAPLGGWGGKSPGRLLGRKWPGRSGLLRAVGESPLVAERLRQPSAAGEPGTGNRGGHRPDVYRERRSAYLPKPPSTKSRRSSGHCFVGWSGAPTAIARDWTVSGVGLSSESTPRRST